MKIHKYLSGLLIVVILALALVTSGCGQTAAAPSPTLAPPPPTAVPATAVPAPVAALDMNAVLAKYISGLPDGFYGIAPDKLNEQISVAKPFLLDVRETKEVADNGYISGSVNIPIRTLAKNLDKLPAKDQPIVVYCASGMRSPLAMTALQLLGYTNIKNLSGGFGAWKSANLAAVTGEPAAAVAGQAPEVNKDLLAAIDKYLSGLPDGYSTVKPADLKDQMAVAKPFILDVREPKEITDNGAVEGSVNIPIRTLFNNLDKLPQDKTAPIVVYCGVGHRGGITMETLQLLGYTNVKNMSGGFTAWVKANLPVVKS
ncbi:MAG: rhodanese-like domain-containing protein [Chloroflexi bacterium]|nr:rhodanese-like domain-containing protein [Chloroflexota bacterium]